MLEFTIRNNREKNGKTYSDFVVQNMNFLLLLLVHFIFKYFSLNMHTALNRMNDNVFLRDLKRFIVDLSLCWMQYAINVYAMTMCFFSSLKIRVTSRGCYPSLSLSDCLIFPWCSMYGSASSKRSATEVKHMHMKIIATRARVCVQHHISMSSQSNSFTFLYRGIIIFFTFIPKKKKSEKKIETQLKWKIYFVL